MEIFGETFIEKHELGEKTQQLSAMVYKYHETEAYLRLANTCEAIYPKEKK